MEFCSAIILERKNTMNSYNVKKIEHSFNWADIDVGKINVYNWEEFKGYDPEAEFQLVHDNNNIYLRMTAHKDYLAAQCTQVNQMVCNDSCMEAFFNIPGMEKGGYLNLEFNCFGVMFLGCGASRADRITVDPEIVKKYITIIVDNDNVPANERGRWSFTCIINKAIFPVLLGVEFTSGECGGNFYKCGERVISHYISWNKIEMDHPDFHRPEHFGKLIFE